MPETIKLKAKSDHIKQWLELKNLYLEKRGFVHGRFYKQIPRTTFDDVKQVTEWWHREMMHDFRRDPIGNPRHRTSRQQWLMARKAIHELSVSANPKDIYPDNEWFWQTATYRAAAYLESRKATPGELSLLFEAFDETIAERIDDAKDLARSVSDLPGRVLDALKKPAWIAGGVIGVAIVGPPIIRALRKPRRYQ